MNIFPHALPFIASEDPFGDDAKSELHTWVSGDPLPDGIDLAARVARVKKLLADGADVHERGDFGDTPLHVTDDIEIAQLLLEAGASVDAINEDGDTPLHSVCSSSPEIAELFIFKGADTEALNSNLETPFKSIMNFRGPFDHPNMVAAFKRGIERRNESLIVAPQRSRRRNTGCAVPPGPGNHLARVSGNFKMHVEERDQGYNSAACTMFLHACVLTRCLIEVERARLVEDEPKNSTRWSIASIREVLTIATSDPNREALLSKVALYEPAQRSERHKLDAALDYFRYFGFDISGRTD